MYTKELKKICEAAENRWNNGGKELYEAMQNSLHVEQSPEYKKNISDNQIPQLEDEFDIDVVTDRWCNIPLWDAIIEDIEKEEK